MLNTCKYVCTSHTLAATCILPNWISVIALSRLFNEKYLGNKIFWTSPKACLAKLKYKLSPEKEQKKKNINQSVVSRHFFSADSHEQMYLYI